MSYEEEDTCVCVSHLTRCSPEISHVHDHWCACMPIEGSKGSLSLSLSLSLSVCISISLSFISLSVSLCLSLFHLSHLSALSVSLSSLSLSLSHLSLMRRTRPAASMIVE